MVFHADMTAGRGYDTHGVHGGGIWSVLGLHFYACMHALPPRECMHGLHVPDAYSVTSMTDSTLHAW